MRRQARILVVGSSNTDLILTCDRLPSPGETITGGVFSQFAGGKGANQAVAAARAGAKVCFIGAHGNDDFGKAARKGLEREGIDVSHFYERKRVPSGVALILIGGKSRENLIAVARSANHTLTRKDVQKAKAQFASSHAVLAQLEVPLEAVQAAAELAFKAGIPFILNPAPVAKLPASLLRLVHTLTPNEHEAELLAGVQGLENAARKLQKMGCRNVVVTLGAKGVILFDDARQVERIPALKVKPVDTVGAGDCFSAWLGLGLAEGLSLRDSAKRAVKAAAIAVTRPGAQAGMPQRGEVKA